MNSNESGAAAEYIAAARLIALGYRVYWPGEQASRHDMLIAKGIDYLKVQVKRATWLKKGRGAYLRVKVSSSTRGVTKPYAAGDYDLLAAVDGDRMWLIPYAEACQKADSLYLDKRGPARARRNRVSFDADRWLVPQP